MNAQNDDLKNLALTAGAVEQQASDLRERAADRKRLVKFECRPGFSCQAVEVDETAGSQRASAAPALTDAPRWSVEEGGADAGLMASP